MRVWRNTLSFGQTCVFIAHTTPKIIGNRYNAAVLTISYLELTEPRALRAEFVGLHILTARQIQIILVWSPNRLLHGPFLVGKLLFRSPTTPSRAVPGWKTIIPFTHQNFASYSLGTSFPCKIRNDTYQLNKLIPGASMSSLRVRVRYYQLVYGNALK